MQYSVDSGRRKFKQHTIAGRAFRRRGAVIVSVTAQREPCPRVRAIDAKREWLSLPARGRYGEDGAGGTVGSKAGAIELPVAPLHQRTQTRITRRARAGKAV